MILLMQSLTACMPLLKATSIPIMEKTPELRYDTMQDAILTRGQKLT